MIPSKTLKVQRINGLIWAEGPGMDFKVGEKI
jgi:hypothetical protein